MFPKICYKVFKYQPIIMLRDDFSNYYMSKKVISNDNKVNDEFTLDKYECNYPILINVVKPKNVNIK